MIFDGYWKKELQIYVKRIKRWQKLSSSQLLNRKYVEHQLNKYILYSAIVIRKMIEEEKDAEKMSEEFIKTNPDTPKLRLELLHYDVPVMRFAFSGDKDSILHNVIPDYYKGKGEHDTLEGEYVGNNIIHSYIWGQGYSEAGKKRRIKGFFVSSDRFKDRYLYAISLEDWISYVLYCAEKCCS